MGSSYRGRVNRKGRGILAEDRPDLKRRDGETVEAFSARLLADLDGSPVPPHEALFLEKNPWFDDENRLDPEGKLLGPPATRLPHNWANWDAFARRYAATFIQWAEPAPADPSEERFAVMKSDRNPGAFIVWVRVFPNPDVPTQRSAGGGLEDELLLRHPRGGQERHSMGDRSGNGSEKAVCSAHSGWIVTLSAL